MMKAQSKRSTELMSVSRPNTSRDPFMLSLSKHERLSYSPFDKLRANGLPELTLGQAPTDDLRGKKISHCNS
jgi:hypothetical protein